ncbi:MAG: H-NS histone family protein [Paracoccaceae bacterium]|nr:H-NS histone family protein [Paracoccaceae bacterium]
MTDINLNAMPLAELKQLQRDVTKAIETFEARKIAEARAELEARAKELGFSLNEIAEASASRSRGPVMAKYRNPANASETWSGRGRKPKWVVAALEAGKSMVDLEI